MATQDKAGTVSMDEMVLSTLATADALAKLLIEKGLIQREFPARKGGGESKVQRRLRSERSLRALLG